MLSLKNLRFFFIMKGLTPLILAIAFYLFSCNTDNSSATEQDIIVRDSTESEQIVEFRAINELLKKDINNANLYLKRAKLFMKYNDLSSAVNDLSRAIKIDSLIPDYYLLKAELLKNQVKLKEAKQTLDQCMLIDNGNVQARIELGWLALVAKNYKQALDYADAALKRDIHNAEAYYLKGMIFEDKQDTVLAISSFNTAIEQENDYYEAYIQLGLLHYYQSNKLAKEYLKNALRIKPNSLEALYAYAMYCQENEEYNEAIETYYKILKINQYREPYFNLGFIHQEYLKVYDVAIENYTKAIAIEPRYLEAYYNRGLCYEELKDYKKAEKDLRHALKLNPQYTHAAIALERVLKK